MNEFNKPTNPPAFPQYPSNFDPLTHGMTLRDYFAAKAMQAILSDQNYSSPDDKLAEASYWIADAMLKAREQ
jgi:hypothetical protein